MTAEISRCLSDKQPWDDLTLLIDDEIQKKWKKINFAVELKEAIWQAETTGENFMMKAKALVPPA